MISDRNLHLNDTPSENPDVPVPPCKDERTIVKILTEGYAIKKNHGWQASSTTCLIISAGMKIITDPGCNRKLLLEALEREQLPVEDIDIVFLSHGHPDHILLSGLFTNARFVTYDSGLIYDEDYMTTFDKHILGSSTEIIPTPGHVPEHISLLVNTSNGIVGIAGDVFWWADGEEQDPDSVLFDPSGTTGMDLEMLGQSREILLNKCDFIIPGHGKMFRVKKSG